MEHLIAAIVDVREKLRRGVFSNEDQVSKGVVLRLLRELGWSIHDPNHVNSEFRVGNRRVDYALLVEPFGPIVLIEVKNVGRLNARGQEQLFDYCAKTGVRLAVFTDGRKWHFYLPAGEGSYEQRRFVTLNLEDDDTSECGRILTRYLGFEAAVSGQSRRDVQDDYDMYRERIIEHYRKSATKQHSEVPCVSVARDLPREEPSFILLGNLRAFTSNRSLMLALLEELARRDEAFCPRYAQRRNDVKRHREDFGANARPNTAPLPGGWWARHGGSVKDQRRRVRAACEAARLKYGRDLVVSLRGDIR